MVAVLDARKAFHFSVNLEGSSSSGYKSSSSSDGAASTSSVAGYGRFSYSFSDECEEWPSPACRGPPCAASCNGEATEMGSSWTLDMSEWHGGPECGETQVRHDSCAKSYIMLTGRDGYSDLFGTTRLVLRWSRTWRTGGRSRGYQCSKMKATGAPKFFLWVASVSCAPLFGRSTPSYPRTSLGHHVTPGEAHVERGFVEGQARADSVRSSSSARTLDKVGRRWQGSQLKGRAAGRACGKLSGIILGSCLEDAEIEEQPRSPIAELCAILSAISPRWT